MRKTSVIIQAIAGAILFAGCGEKGIPIARMESGKKVYEVYCQSCHMEDGAGVPRMNAPLTESAYVSEDTKKLVRVVLEGSAAFTEYPPRSYKNVMASMAQLNDEQVADVLTYIRNSFGNKASMVMPDEVKAVREKKN